MIISHKLPQFENKALIIVAGRRVAEFLQAFNGEIVEIDSVTVEIPRDQKKESLFMRLGKGQFFGAGSVLEDKNQETDKRFLKEVKEKTISLSEKNEIKEIYFFASDHIRKSLPEALTENIREKIILVVQGNYLKTHPLKLIEKIQRNQENNKTKFISEAAMKILRKKKD
jgi:hypothetical protein